MALVQVWEIQTKERVTEYHVAFDMKVDPSGTLDFGNLSSDGNWWRWVTPAKGYLVAREIARCNDFLESECYERPVDVAERVVAMLRRGSPAWEALTLLIDAIRGKPLTTLPDGIFRPDMEANA